MPKLSETRRKLRLHSYLRASDLIEMDSQTGALPEDYGMTDKEFEIYDEECKRTAKLLLKMALKHYKDGDFEDEK